MSDRPTKFVIESIPTLTPESEARIKAVFSGLRDADWRRFAIPERIALGGSQSYTSRKIESNQFTPIVDGCDRLG